MIVSQPDVLRLWTIYFDPLDHPDLYVVRAWTIQRGGLDPTPDAFCLVFEALAAAREAVPAGLCRLERTPEDDPCVVESWI